MLVRVRWCRWDCSASASCVTVSKCCSEYNGWGISYERTTSKKSALQGRRQVIRVHQSGAVLGLTYGVALLMKEYMDLGHLHAARCSKTAG